MNDSDNDRIAKIFICFLAMVIVGGIYSIVFGILYFVLIDYAYNNWPLVTQIVIVLLLPLIYLVFLWYVVKHTGKKTEHLISKIEKIE